MSQGTFDICEKRDHFFKKKYPIFALVAVDSVNDPVVLALNATSAALATSPIPWDGGPLGAVRVGYIPANRSGH